jgi:NAD-dependent SIR2 family protein deacetylase
MDANSITADDFARRFSMRSGSLMWFLGAGASAAAGIPTAWQMIWEFKQRLFVSQRKVSPQAVADLSNERIRQQLQAHIDSAGSFPEFGAPKEYADLFEAVFPSEADRRSYIDSKLTGARPSFGHLALATLMRAEVTKLIWTTNFDSLVADAAAKLYDSTGHLSVVDLDAPELAEQLIGDGRWPIEVKIHGDFRSRRLKNTDDELRHQDVRLRKVLVDSCRRFGLIVAGYSGRDDSVMDALEEALSDSGSFPAGLFWLHRGDNSPLPRVTQLVNRANEANVEAAIVSIDNFDEVLRDLIRLLDGIDTATLNEFASGRVRWSPAPRPNASKSWPVIRLNAIPVVEAPTVCRRVDCEVGGFVETRDAVKKAGVNVLASRVRFGVLCFGSDADVRQAFQPHGIKEFDLQTIQAKRLRYESAEQGLLRDAMTAALVRERNFDVFRRRHLDLLAPKNVRSAEFARLRTLAGDLSGVVKDHPDLRWREGVGVRLEWANDQLWLLIEPCTVFEPFDAEQRGIVADYSRERTVRRYNKQLNDLLDFWTQYIAGDEGPMRALGVSDGVDAVFRLSKVTAFSRMATP